MNTLRRWSVLVLCILLFPSRANFAVAQGQKSAAPQKITDLAPTVLLIALDGFRHDYIDKAPAPTLRQLASEGVRAEGLVPVFPTKTFPNHYSIVTGLYPENHGVVGNNMWDDEFQASFSLSNRKEVQSGRWWGGEPIWVTAIRQGQKAATLFWPGSEAEISGHRPTFWKAYTGEMTHEQRVAQVLAWLDLPRDQRPTFLCMYFSDTDDTGHNFGPESPENMRSVARLDYAISLLMDGLKERGIADKVNLLVVADHGMSETSPERMIVLDDFVDVSDLVLAEVNPVLMAKSKSGRDEQVYRALANSGQPLRVFRREELPERWHLRRNRRVPPVVAVAEDGWTITTRDWLSKHPQPDHGGNHGYDQALPSMWGVLIAHGPAFAQKRKVGAVQNIDLYPLMTHILGLKPAKNDGSLERVKTMLRVR